MVKLGDGNDVVNVGTGAGRSWLDLGRALFAALDQPPRIEFIDMPTALRDKYQYFTEANVARLQAAGYDTPFTTLEDGVCDYVRTYLTQPDRYR